LLLTELQPGDLVVEVHWHGARRYLILETSQWEDARAVGLLPALINVSYVPLNGDPPCYPIWPDDTYGRELEERRLTRVTVARKGEVIWEGGCDVAPD